MYQREADAIVRDWQEVVRHLGRVVVGSPEAIRLVDEGERLVEEYRVLSGERFSATGIALPPFPSTIDK